jgi:hypothetical protein
MTHVLRSFPPVSGLFQPNLGLALFAGFANQSMRCFYQALHQMYR